MNISSLVNLQEGKLYSFVYQLPGQRVKRQGVAMYLDRKVMNNGTITLVLSGRPEFGTTEINSQHLISVEQTEGTRKPFMDRKLS